MSHCIPTSPPPPVAEPVTDLTEEPQVNPAGVVSHQDHFSAPQEPPKPTVNTPDRLSSLLRRSRRSLPVNKPQLQTVLALSIDSVSSGPVGIVVNLTTIYRQRLELLVQRIHSISYADEIVERSLIQASLRQTATELFGTSMSAEEWNKHLADVAIPAICGMSASWIGNLSGNLSGNMANPVDGFFFGTNGLLDGSLDQESVRQRLSDLEETDGGDR